MLRYPALPQTQAPIAPYTRPPPAHHKAHGTKAPPATAIAAAPPRSAHTCAPAARSHPARATPTADRSGYARQPRPHPHARQAPPAPLTNLTPGHAPEPASEAPAPLYSR